MSLTPLLRSTLRYYQGYRDKPPTLWSLWEQSSKNHAILFMVVSLGSIYLYLDVSRAVGLFFAGIGVGAILRDIGRFRAFARIWPVLAQILDWKKIDDLLDDREKTM